MSKPSSFTIVIPARFGSSRFPGKPLHHLNGKPMVLHVVDRARESEANDVVVATDDERIAAVCRDANVDVEMTSIDHPSGTDRIAEIASRRGWDDSRIIVGLQGDEPTTPSSHLNLLASNLDHFADADMATLCMAVASAEEYRNANRVKVVRDARSMALYFSRASLPHRRDDVQGSEFPESYIHVGLYAYRCGYLRRYCTLTPSLAEREEQLEQLRVLHHGGCIHVDEIPYAIAHGVDLPEDVAMTEHVLQSEFNA